MPRVLNGSAQAWFSKLRERIGAIASPLAATAERRGVGLSAKLLMLTVLFVMLAEVLIFVPSIANFRITWLTDRLTAAQLAALAAEAVPDGAVPPSLRGERTRVFGLGPEVDVIIPRWQTRVALRAEHELGVTSRPQGNVISLSAAYFVARPR